MFIVRPMKACQGFSLIEVMISVFILSVGLLGVASMQSSSIRMNVGAYNQSQANILIAEMLDRMRLNRDGCVSYNSNTEAEGGGACDDGCDALELADSDIREFAGFFRDVGELGDNFVALIPGGRAEFTCVVGDPTHVATVEVQWEQDVWSSDANKLEKSSTTQVLTMTVKI